MLIALIPVIVLLVGLLCWALAVNPIVKEAGRIAFFIGLMWAVYPFSGKFARLL
jgi:hypothetical protein